MIDRILRRMMHADALGILVAALALLTFTHGISSSLRNPETSDFFWICLAAAAISFELGKIRLNGIQASVGMAALGVIFVWILGARLTSLLLVLPKAIYSDLSQIVQTIRFGTSVDVTAISDAWNSIMQASSALITRLENWFSGINQGVVINDTLIQNMIWALVLWLCAAWMGWFAEKCNPIACLLPMLIVLSAVTSYSEYGVDSLWILLLLLLLLMGIWCYRNHTTQWLKQHIDYSDSIRFDNSRAVIFLTLAVGTFAIITPSFSWRDIIEDLRERQNRNETAELLGIQEPRLESEVPKVQESSMPRDHLLRGGFANSEKVVMTIRTGELPPIASQSVPVNAPRHYWRSVVYDQYAGTGWVISTVAAQNVSANTPLVPGLLDEYRLLQMDVHLFVPEGKLFWSGILFSSNVPVTAYWRVKPPPNLFADQSALLLADMVAASTNTQIYHVESYILSPTITVLRSSSTNYPEEIRSRYLYLPSSVPERVHELAREITAGLTNPYDKAKAIESYLRTNYPYTLDIPRPPEERDAADYFLFELKKGYCDYYATAMVVLARSSGIPARFVSGYSPGAYDAPNAQYVVRELNAHSWVEVYFPEIGWVEFEPTASLPEIERTEGFAPVPSDRANEENASKILSRFRLEQILLWVSPVLMILAGIILYIAFIERWLVLRLAPENAIGAVYQRFYRAGRPLAGAWTQAETSSEFLHKLLDRVSEMRQLDRFKKLSTGINTNAITLTDIYHASIFMDRQTGKHDAVLAWQVWKQLRTQLFISRLLHRISRDTSRQPN